MMKKFIITNYMGQSRAKKKQQHLVDSRYKMTQFLDKPIHACILRQKNKLQQKQLMSFNRTATAATT